jgi:5-methylthioadenosine/S-adenosylhomocysteine deaminase
MRTIIEHVDIFPGALQKENKILPTIKNACAHIDNGVFTYVGTKENAPAFPADQVLNGRGQLMMPSLVNAHSHNAMTLLRGIGSDLPLASWLFGAILPLERKMTVAITRVGVQLALLEHLRFGTTLVNDMYFHIRDEVDMIKASGMRALLCDACVDMGNGKEQLYDALAFFAEQDHQDERIHASVSLHAEYTSNPEFITMLLKATEGLDNIIHIHVSETSREVEECIERHGKTPVRYLRDLGLFTSKTVAAHCVAISREDIDILAANSVAVAHCPVSNLKLGSGIAPVSTMLNQGVSVTLGTDGASSNNNLNLWEEIKLMSLLHKGTTGDATVVTPAQSLAAATSAGAAALGFKNVGLIQEGYSADLILLDVDKPHIIPSADIGANLTYTVQGSDVTMTMACGKVLYQDGEYRTLDKEKICYEAKAASKALLRS